MDIVISRILKYLNGCLDNDHMYQIGLFIVRHYVDMEDYSLERLMKEGQFSEAEVLDFCVHLGFHTYEDFQEQLLADYMSVSYTHLDVYKRQRCSSSCLRRFRTCQKTWSQNLW